MELELEECRNKILSNDYIDWIVDFPFFDYLERETDGTVYDFCYQEVNDEFGIVSIKQNSNKAEDLQLIDSYYFPDLLGLEEIPDNMGAWNGDNNFTFNPEPLLSLGVIGLQNPPLSLTGQGVVMAFVDTGIQYENPLFCNPDGSTRILSIWDQTIQSGKPPQGFFYGSEYTKEMINEALNSDDPKSIVPTQDEIGHGTKMVSAAAGSMLDGGAGFLSPSPNADIVIVKLKQCKDYMREYYLIPPNVPAYQSNDLMMAMRYLDRFALELRRPVVFCIGMGSNYRSHAGYGVLSSYLNSIARERSRVVVVGGGNEGNASHHFEGRLSVPQNDGTYQDSSIDMEVRVSNRVPGFLLQIWTEAPNVLEITIRTPGGEFSPKTSILMQGSMKYRFVYEKGVVTVINAPLERGSGDALILLRFENPTGGIWTVTVNNFSSLPNTVFHAWLPITQFLQEPVYFLQPNPNLTLTTPSYSEQPITVSTYDSFQNSFYVNSGRGFSRRGGIKPDFASPGVNVSTTFRTINDYPVIQGATGSSLAAALAAGTVGQFMQWAVVEGNAPYTRSLEVKNYFIRGALREDGIAYPSRQWGFGRINLQGVFDAMIR